MMEEKNHPSYENRAESLFWTDTLISFDFYNVALKKRLLEPEKRLMLAVLSDALHRYQRSLFTRNESSKEYRREVESWFGSKNGDWIFSFENICGEFAIDPEWIRGKLEQWKRKRAGHGRKVRVLNPRIKNGLKTVSRGTGNGTARVSAR